MCLHPFISLYTWYTVVLKADVTKRKSSGFKLCRIIDLRMRLQSGFTLFLNRRTERCPYGIGVRTFKKRLSRVLFVFLQKIQNWTLPHFPILSHVASLFSTTSQEMKACRRIVSEPNHLIPINNGYDDSNLLPGLGLGEVGFEVIMTMLTEYTIRRSSLRLRRSDCMNTTHQLLERRNTVYYPQNRILQY